MRTLSANETKNVEGGWLQIAVFVAKAAWAGYRYYRSAQTAAMAAQAAAHISGAAGIAGGTYGAAKIWGPQQP